MSLSGSCTPQLLRTPPNTMMQSLDTAAADESHGRVTRPRFNDLVAGRVTCRVLSPTQGERRAAAHRAAAPDACYQVRGAVGQARRAAGLHVEFEGKHMHVVLELHERVNTSAHSIHALQTCHGRWPSVPPTTMNESFRPTAAAYARALGGQPDACATGTSRGAMARGGLRTLGTLQITEDGSNT
jgi:hypothetical protein